MDMRRVISFSALFFVGYSLWMAWQHDYPPVNKVLPAENKIVASSELLPTITDNASTAPSEATTEKNIQPNLPGKLIEVKTDVLSLVIDTKYGDIVQAQLLQYPVSVDEPQTPIDLLYDKPNQKYVANSSLVIKTTKGVENLDVAYEVASTDVELATGQDALTILLKGKTSTGLSIKKTFTLKRGSYLVDVNYDLDNLGDENWVGFVNTQLLRTAPTEEKSSMFSIGSYTGASYANPGQHRYKKVSFKDMSKDNLNVTAKGGWIAMQQHYFLSAWVPNPDSNYILYSRAAQDDYTIGAVSQQINLAAGRHDLISAKLYLGPEDTDVLKSISPGLELTVDYGWLWFLSSLLFSLMKLIHSVVGNWGFAIVLVTVLVKLAFYRLSASSYRSMAGMRKLQPKLQALRDRYGDDKAKMSQATMELYRSEKVNPLGGCLPILIQIPVFIALYWVLIESVELRQAPFIFWIKDLAAADPYHVLPVIMGLTMLIQQRLNPAPPDPMQAKMMMFLPVVFTALFWSFPSGLVLYWIVNNTLSIAQQWFITYRYEHQQEKTTSKKPLSIVK